MSIYQTGGFSARDNYSIGANRFFDSVFTANPATVVLQGNTVLDTKDDTAVSLSNEGPHMFMDNVFRSRVGFTGNPVIQSTSYQNATAPLIGNTYGNSNTTRQNESVQMTTVLPGYDDTTVARSSINPPQPTLPGELPNLGRAITEVSTKTGAAIQSAINTACASNGTRPVVHLPYGNYSVSSTITIPVCDVQNPGRWNGGCSGDFLSLDRSRERACGVDGRSIQGNLTRPGDQRRRDSKWDRYKQRRSSWRTGLHGPDDPYDWCQSRTTNVKVNGLDLMPSWSSRTFNRVIRSAHARVAPISSPGWRLAAGTYFLGRLLVLVFNLTLP